MFICVGVSSQDSVHLLYVSYKEFLFNKTTIQAQVAWDWLENRTDSNDKSQVQQQVLVCVCVCVCACMQGRKNNR